MYEQQRQDDIEHLQDIMSELPDSAAFSEERRKHSLTRDDVLIIFRIAKIAGHHQCPFDGIAPEEASTVRTVGASINRTQKIASVILITGIVSATLAGIWAALKHFALEWIKTGGAIK